MNFHVRTHKESTQGLPASSVCVCVVLLGFSLLLGLDPCTNQPTDQPAAHVRSQTDHAEACSHLLPSDRDMLRAGNTAVASLAVARSVKDRRLGRPSG